MLAGPDLLVILVIALIVFGPKKLPEIGQSIGKAMREFKKASEDMRGTFEERIQEVENTKVNPTSVDPITVSSGKSSGPAALPERMGESKTEHVIEMK